MAESVYLLTESDSKITAARAALEPEFTVVPVAPDVPEIQAETSIEVARHQAIAAARLLQVPVVREDHQTSFAALNDMPGPFAAYFERALPVERLLDLLEGRDRSAHWVLAMAYATPDGECVTFEHRVEFTLALEPRGHHGTSWNRAMVPVGEHRTLAEYDAAERLPMFAVNYERLKAHLLHGAASGPGR